MTRRARLVTVCAAVTALVCGCQPGTQGGWLELRWTIPRGGTDDLAAVSLAPTWAGAGQGPTRDEGWREIEVIRNAEDGGIRFPTPGERPVVVARGPLPAGHYSHVYAAAGRVYGFTADGSRMMLTNHVEPIARGFDLGPGGKVTIDIELIVLARAPQSGGGWQIFAKDAWIAGPDGADDAVAIARRCPSTMPAVAARVPRRVPLQ